MAQEASYQEVNEFIRRELKRHGEWLTDRFIEQLEKNGNKITGELEQSLGWNLYDPGDGSAAGLQVGFEPYGRFFEIRGRKNRTGKANSMPPSTNSLVWGTRQRKKKKKQTRWYARNMYGGLGKLISRLSAGISDDELQRIRQTLSETATEMKMV